MKSPAPSLGGPGQPIVVEARTQALLAECVTVIREAFATVADEFGVTEQRVPTNPAYLTLDRIRKAQLRGDQVLALVVAARVVGSVSLRAATTAGVVDLERLAVSPLWRHRGYGALLLNHAYPLAAAGGGNAVRVGIIAANTVLRSWYEHHGFTVIETRSFEHLPFTVCYLQRGLLGAEGK